MKLLRLVWRKVAEPRVHRTGFFVIYLLHTLGGLAILSTVLGDYRLVLGEVITTVWSGFLVLGGATGAASVLSGRNYIERVGILSLFVGFVLAVIVLSATPPSPEVWPSGASWSGGSSSSRFASGRFGFT